MPESTEPTPPPERPLPDRARARIRAELLGHAQGVRGTSPRWIIPAGSAAAVALVAGLSYWAVSVAGNDDGSLPVTGGGTSTTQAASTGPSAAVPSAAVPSDAASSDAVPSSVPETEVTLPAPPGGSVDEAGTGSCGAELENVLPGARDTFDASSEVSFWVKGDRFTLCYRADGSTTVTHPLSLSPQDGVDTYRVASIYPPTADGYRTVRFAGGAVPEGVQAFDVSYTFPDGHTEHAQTAADDTGRRWWWMLYSYDDGGGNELKKPEIKVTATTTAGPRTYTLTWAVDTCAQANHGC